MAEYLKRYVATLTQNVRIDRLQLTVIDGFAGGNIYKDERTGDTRPGSPSVILRALREAGELAGAGRTKPFTLDDAYCFIEKDDGAFSSLKATLRDSEFADLIDHSIHLIQGAFADQTTRLINFVNQRGGAGRSLFVLDQCGYSAVTLQAINNILASIRNAEVILTFATDFLIDYLADDDTSRSVIDSIGLDHRELLSGLDKTDPLWRKTIQFGLHNQIKQRTSAQFYTPFFIRSRDSHRDFWLIHLSGHHRAKDVMVGLHWELQNSFAHFGKPGLKMLGYDPNEDPRNFSQLSLPFNFDEDAKKQTTEALREQLPKYMYDTTGTTNFNSLFSLVSNETPASSDILRQVLGELAHEGLISIRDKTGHTSRRCGVQSHSDVIVVPRQRRLIW